MISLTRRGQGIDPVSFLGIKIPSDGYVRGHGASVHLCGHGFFGEFHDGVQIGDGGVVQLAAALFSVAEGGEGDAVGAGDQHVPDSS